MLFLSLFITPMAAAAFQSTHRQLSVSLDCSNKRCRAKQQTGAKTELSALSEATFFDGDLVAIRSNRFRQRPEEEEETRPRLCVVRSDGIFMPLCTREDDVETDLFADPREYENPYWATLQGDAVIGRYGEGFYGQRPVPSLGGGPGYGAQANEIWSISEEILTQITADNVEIPKLDVGIAHGEKARGGFF
jgi:hypothetical protein